VKCLVSLLLSIAACAQTGPLHSLAPHFWTQRYIVEDFPTEIRQGQFVEIIGHCPFEHCEVPEFNYTSADDPATKFGQLGPSVDPYDSQAYQFFITWAPSTGTMHIYIPTPFYGAQYQAMIIVLNHAPKPTP
jgi:hypothetical protein